MSSRRRNLACHPKGVGDNRDSFAFRHSPGQRPPPSRLADRTTQRALYLLSKTIVAQRHGKIQRSPNIMHQIS